MDSRSTRAIHANVVMLLRLRFTSISAPGWLSLEKVDRSLVVWTKCCDALSGSPVSGGVCGSCSHEVSERLPLFCAI